MQRINRFFVLALMGLMVVIPSQAQEAKDYLKAISEVQADLYENVAPSVVRIRTSKANMADAMKDSNPFHQFQQPDGTNPFEEWFKLIPQQPQGQGQQFTPQQDEGEGSTQDSDEPQFFTMGIGSGIIVEVSERGVWILTNNHVIEDADQIEIDFHHELTLTDLELVTDPKSDKRNAYLDRKTDLAMIFLTKEQIGGRDLKAATFGDSSTLRTGQMVYTLGAPLDREWSFGQGIVSGMGRDQVLPRRGRGAEREMRYEGFIQTTAFINVGNSGGPLLDIEGNVVGINVAIQTAGGFSNGFIGIGFAIPSNRAKMVVESFIEKGKIERGWLGVAIGPPDPNDLAYYDLDPYSGVKVAEVFDDTPAAKGGMRKNDIVIAFNGIDVNTPAHLQELVALAPIDKDARIQVLRGGEKVELSVPIGLQPEEPGTVAKTEEFNFPELGATLRNTTPEEAAYYQEKGGYSGVMVEEVKSNGPLENGVSIKKGSLITGIENTRFKTVEDLRTYLDNLKEQVGTKREKLVMLKYVAAGSSGDVEEFQVVKLRFE
jgi:serine protease Do